MVSFRKRRRFFRNALRGPLHVEAHVCVAGLLCDRRKIGVIPQFFFVLPTMVLSCAIPRSSLAWQPDAAVPLKKRRAYSKYNRTARLLNGDKGSLLQSLWSREMNPFSQRQGVPQKLDRSELLEASMWIAARWFDRFVSGSGGPAASPDLTEFGTFEVNIAEVVVLDQGGDFVFPKWGAALSTLCGGNRRGHRLSAFPQPSRGQLRRVCVRATAGQVPEAEQATWVVDGRIWQCAMLALPTAGNELSATRLLVALLFVPHPMFVDAVIPSPREHESATATLASQSIFPIP